MRKTYMFIQHECISVTKKGALDDASSIKHVL
jgi:hypothetical protein